MYFFFPYDVPVRRLVGNRKWGYKHTPLPRKRCTAWRQKVRRAGRSSGAAPESRINPCLQLVAVRFETPGQRPGWTISQRLRARREIVSQKGFWPPICGYKVSIPWVTKSSPTQQVASTIHAAARHGFGSRIRSSHLNSNGER